MRGADRASRWASRLCQGALPTGRTVAGQVVLALVWAVAITAVFAPLAVRGYRRTVS